MRMLKQGEEAPDSEVSWEDQSKINRFSKLNAKMSELEESYEEKKKEMEYLDDLTQELELCDEEELIKYKLGDVFVSMPYSEVQAFIERDGKKIDSEVSSIKESIASTTSEMEKLKVALYSRFGNAINLERE